MAFVIPEGLAPEVYPLAFLVGRWRGSGEVAYPQVPRAEVVADVVVDHDGGPYLTWSAQLRLKDDDHVWATESGFWRVPPDRPADLPEGRFPVELLLADPAGHLTLYAGVVGNGRIDLASDLVARTPDAAELTAATRLYGMVEGELMWTWDIAAFGEPLQSYAAARMSRVG
ncbi:FABP family protein [Actinotalea sp. M2MS4P-6]|uniref:FABP family protein n=1 Tax=Actinotalea sp. M2MS4P-6 TaxID=2983762 RepID=UPI0021E41C95|nr:FABP family protein [Actinotalea sp. M2MS4P-6]MCV2393190.1 FABP family protein [Actinotalea sp. M2MS4P-6]